MRCNANANAFRMLVAISFAALGSIHHAVWGHSGQIAGCPMNREPEPGSLACQVGRMRDVAKQMWQSSNVSVDMIAQNNSLHLERNKMIAPFS